MQHRRRIVGDTRIGVDDGADHGHDDGRRGAVAGDVGHQDAEAILARAAARRSSRRRHGGWSGSSGAKLRRRVRRHRRRQSMALHAARRWPARGRGDRGSAAARARDAAATGGPHTRQHFLGLNRLGDVVDRAEFEARHLVGHFAARRQKNHDRVARLGLPTLITRQTSKPSMPGIITSSSIRSGFARRGDLERGGAVPRRENAMAAAVQRAHEHLQVGGAVVDDENRRRRRGGRRTRQSASVTSCCAFERAGQLAHAVEIKVRRERARCGGRAPHRVIVAGGQSCRRSRADR